MRLKINLSKVAGDAYGIPVLKFDEVVARRCGRSQALGPLHTEFDNRGNAYTLRFLYLLRL